MRRPGHRNNLKYHAHRFPGVTAAELEAAAARLGALLGRNFADLRITRMQEHIFRIES
jgi:precorrin-3B methylase